MPKPSDKSLPTKAETRFLAIRASSDKSKMIASPATRLLEIKTALAKSGRVVSNPREGEFLGALEQQMLIFPPYRDSDFLVPNTLPASLNPEGYPLFDVDAFAASFGYTKQGDYINLSSVHFYLLSASLSYVKFDFANLDSCDFSGVRIYSAKFTNNMAYYFTSDPDNPLLLSECDLSTTYFSSVEDNHGQPTEPLGLIVRNGIGNDGTTFGGAYTKSQLDFISANGLSFPVKGGVTDSTITIAGNSDASPVLLNGQFTRVTFNGGSFANSDNNIMPLVITECTISGSFNLVSSEYTTSPTFSQTKFTGGELSGSINTMVTCQLQQATLADASITNMTNCVFNAATVRDTTIQTARSTQFQHSVLRDTEVVVLAKQCNFPGSKLYGVTIATVVNCNFEEAIFNAKEPSMLGNMTGSNFLHATCDTSSSNRTSTRAHVRRLVTSTDENRALVLANNATIFPTCHEGRTTPLLTDGCIKPLPSSNFNDNKGLPCAGVVPTLFLYVILGVAVTGVVLLIVAGLYQIRKRATAKSAAASADLEQESAATTDIHASINSDTKEDTPLLPASTTDNDPEQDSCGFNRCFR